MEIDKKILSSKILIIDDDVNIGVTLEDFLKENGFNMSRYISDSREAEAVYQQFHPDLVLLDIRMPNLDGFKVLERFKSLNGNSFVPIVMLTGQSDESLCLQALGAGAADFLNKPIKLSEVLARIQNLLKVRVLQLELENRKDFLEEKVRDKTAQLRQVIVQLDQMNTQLKEAYIETIYRLTRATEYKDEDTADHVKRLSLYAATMGRAIGMNEADVEILLYASPMHDIGKIGIPDRILFKKSPLDDEEWKIMKTHTTIGYEILRGSSAPVLRLASVIALNHHERWDGSGYPNGLKGEEIPVEARILGLIDVYDALRSKRHYKEGFDHEMASKIILEGDGRVKPEHFDPKLLDAFRRIHLEFKEIFDKNNK